MHGSYAHRKLTAWLGLLAIWLGVLMPVVSQSVRSLQAPELETVLCVAGDEGGHVLVPLGDDHDGAHAAHSGWQACGYCGLLALHLPVFDTAVQTALAEDGPLPAPPAPSSTIDLRPVHTPAVPRAPPALA